MSNIVRVTKETVSLEKLQEHLPESCYNAIIEGLNSNSRLRDESIYRHYFESEPTPPLTQEEQEQLFEQLGNQWVKNHYSTETLRSLLDKEPSQKRNRRHD